MSGISISYHYTTVNVLLQVSLVLLKSLIQKVVFFKFFIFIFVFVNYVLLSIFDCLTISIVL